MPATALKVICMFLIIIPFNAFAQNANQSLRNRFTFSAGYGLAASFFVNSYSEKPVFGPEDVYFYNKKINGSVGTVDIGWNFKNNYSLHFAFNRQHFTKAIQYNTMMSNVVLMIDREIYHKDNIYTLSLLKRLKSTKGSFQGGLGIYYLRSEQNEIEVLKSMLLYMDTERAVAGYGLEEGGAMAEFGYDYYFQPRVAIGLKSAFYFTITTGEAESVILLPYIRLLF